VIVIWDVLINFFCSEKDLSILKKFNFFLLNRFHQHEQVLVKVVVMNPKKKRNRNFEHHHFLKNVKKKKKQKKLLIKRNLKQKDNHIYLSLFSSIVVVFSFFVEKILFVHNTLTFSFLVHV
jgi:hypothetical protein